MLWTTPSPLLQPRAPSANANAAITHLSTAKHTTFTGRQKDADRWGRCPGWTLQPAAAHDQGHLTAAEQGQKYLPASHPHLLKEWDYERNTILPEELTAGSGYKAHWRCLAQSCGHTHFWQAPVHLRARQRTGCPLCAGIKPCHCNSLAVLRPGLAEQWHPSVNGDQTPADFSVGSDFIAIWECKQHPVPFSWPARISDRSQGTGCPECAKISRRQRRDLLKDEHPELAEQLHPTLNPDLNLAKLTSGSGQQAVWICSAPQTCNHRHIWTTSIRHRTRGQGCPFCSGRMVCPCNSLKAKHPEIAAQWDCERNEELWPGLAPDTCPPASPKKVAWRHNAADGTVHEWEARVSSRTLYGTDCPFCAPSRSGRGKLGTLNRYTDKFQKVQA